MKQISSKSNPDFKAWKKLAAFGRERHKKGRVLLEGLHLVADWDMDSLETLLVSQKGFNHPEISAWLQKSGQEITLLSDALFADLAGTETPSGILAVAIMPPRPTLPAFNSNSLILDGLQDPGNLGTILRTAAAAGISQVLLSADCVDIWSPKVLRAGEGAHLRLKIFTDIDLPVFLKNFQGETLATTLNQAYVPESLYTATWQEPLAWVFGSEGQGVRHATLLSAQKYLYIPLSGGMESLNVGAAVAVCLFEMVRRQG